MQLSKWNYELHDYELFNSPAVKISLYGDDMDKLVDCANCGKELPFGECYTSMEIHNVIGFGYGVCDDCYKEEHKRRKESDEKI